MLKSFAAAVPTVQAEVAEPVLEELMGGCSLRCAFSWSVEVTEPDGKPEITQRLNDESATTAWTSAAQGGGVGTKFRLLFPAKLTVEQDRTPVYGLDLINGNWKNEPLWREHARLKKVRLFYKRKALQDVVFADSRRWQRVLFPDIYVRAGDYLTVEVLEVYPAAKGLALSEFVLEGAH
ncbi:MAG TPA: hypothetical protein VF614_07145 [Chthoniobacteraceae bacterium]